MNSRRRMQVYRTTHLLHWISAAVCLAALLLFSITGVTLNHAGSIGAKPVVTTRSAQLPDTLRAALARAATRQPAVPPALADWIESEFDISATSARAAVIFSSTRSTSNSVSGRGTSTAGLTSNISDQNSRRPRR